MAYLKFLNEETIHNVSVIPSGNIVTLKFKNEDKIINTSGFDVYLDKNCSVNIGQDVYHSFTTIYKNDGENKAEYQLSNDNSVYIDPEPIPEVEPTLEEIKEQKISEMNSVQQEIIENGVDVILTDGTTHHFSLTSYDQISLMGLQSEVASGSEKIPWHTSNETEHCQYFSNADMKIIVTTALQLVTTQVTYFRDLRIYINSLEDKESVEAITYGVYIPEKYQSEVLRDIYTKQTSQVQENEENKES